MTEETNKPEATTETTNKPEATADEETPVTESEQVKLSICEDQLLRAKADYQNLERISKIEISQKVALKTNQLMLGFVGIYEDFIRAKSALENESANIDGL